MYKEVELSQLLAVFGQDIEGGRGALAPKVHGDFYDVGFFLAVYWAFETLEGGLEDSISREGEVDGSVEKGAGFVVDNTAGV